MATITLVKARSIFDSRGNPTVEVDIYLSDGYLSRAAVPSGASTGVYEALELRDGGKNYMGKGVSKAVESVNKIIGPALIGKDPVEQTGIDDFMVQELDGTQNQWGWCKQKNNNGSQKISGSELIKLYEPFIEDYPIVSIEDPFDQDNWAHYAQFTATIGEKVQIVGDDLLVTNPKRVGKAINEKSCNALLLKVNEIGSVTESIEEVKMFKRAGCGVMTSHRSGETEDTFIADLAVGLATGQIKTGASCMQVMDNSWMNTLSFVDLIVRGNTAQVLVEALVDTGATHNFMKTWLAREVGLTIVPCNAEVTALNSNVEVKGLAHKVPVQIEDWTGQLDFTVMEMKNFDVILGQDFLKGNKATVIPYLDVVALDGQPRNWTFTTHRQQMGGVIVERFA